MRIPGSRKVRTAARWLRSRWRGRLLVLGYHRVDGGSDAFGLAVRPETFAAQLDVLAERARVLPLAEAVARLGAGSLPARAVVLTFDDGYADLATRVAPMLAARDMTATAFIATGYIGGEFWWDRLVRLVGAGGDGARLYELQEQLEPLAVAERDGRLSGLEAGRAPASPAEPRALTAEELGVVAAGGVVELGAHTVRHPRLTSLDAASREWELRESKRYLEELTGRPVTAFSYPHGAYNRAIRAEVGVAGYRVGCCSLPEVGRRSSDPLALPRLWPGDWPADHFGAWLERWLPRGGS